MTQESNERRETCTEADILQWLNEDLISDLGPRPRATVPCGVETTGSAGMVERILKWVTSIL